MLLVLGNLVPLVQGHRLVSEFLYGAFAPGWYCLQFSLSQMGAPMRTSPLYLVPIVGKE